MGSAVLGEHLLPETLRKLHVRRELIGISKRSQWALFLGTLVVTDLLTIGLAFLVAYFLRFELSIPVFQLNVVPSVDNYRSLVMALIPAWLILFGLIGLYSPKNLLGGTVEYSLIFNATVIGMFAAIGAGFLATDLVFARGWLLLAWLLAFLFVASGRFAMRRVIYMLRSQGFFLKTAVIVGANEESRLLAEQMSRLGSSGRLVMGFVDDAMLPGAPVQRDLRCLGSLNDLEDVISVYKVEEIILTSSALSREQVMEVFQRYGVCEDIDLRMSSGLYEIMTTGLRVKEVASVPLLEVNKVRLTGSDRLLKNLLDYSLGLLALVIAAPLMGLIALMVRLDSPGPVIHRRRVMGVNGKQFDAFKFRTMVVNGDEILERFPAAKEELARNHKIKDDPRITRMGKLLRKTSLDELPQIINVLRNEMSMVGPRMISPEEMEMYSHLGMNLLTVHPGITGLWQVSGRSDVTYQERVRLDMFYIRNWSIWLDLHLLLQTIPAVLKSRGAY